MDLMVSEMCNHPEENNGVIWGGFFCFVLFVWQGAVVVFSLSLFFFLGYAFKNFGCFKDACT